MKESDKVLADIRRDVQRARKRKRSRIEKLQRLAQINAGNRDLTGGPWSVVYADPPWQYDLEDVGSTRDILGHYPTMATDDICKLPVANVSESDSVLFLWCTAPLLPDGLRVMESWGFKYKTHSVWRKRRYGMGFWFRICHEDLLVGTRGSFPTPPDSLRMPSVFDGDYAGHSVKPDCIAEYLELSYPGLSKVELFCRYPREGWSAWGNEI